MVDHNKKMKNIDKYIAEKMNISVDEVNRRVRISREALERFFWYQEQGQYEEASKIIKWLNNDLKADELDRYAREYSEMEHKLYMKQKRRNRKKGLKTA